MSFIREIQLVRERDIEMGSPCHCAIPWPLPEGGLSSRSGWASVPRPTHVGTCSIQDVLEKW